MKPIRPTLVALFSRLSCAQIEASTAHLLQAFDEDSFEQLAAQPGYAEEYAHVRTAKWQLERIASRYAADNGDQALQCLCLLKELRARSRFEGDEYLVTRALIDETLSKGWPEVDRRTYLERRVVFDWCDFFLSYTNRDANATNERYRRLVTAEYGWPSLAERSQYNYVARVVAKFFEQQNLRGFADFKTLQCGDDIKDKVVQHCRSAIAFVQLVESGALNEPAPPVEVNWCHAEYSEFSAAGFPVRPASVPGNRRFFVLAGGQAFGRPAGSSPHYEAWYQDIEARLQIVIDRHNVRPWDALKSKVREVAVQIVAAREALANAMLATWH